MKSSFRIAVLAAAVVLGPVLAEFAYRVANPLGPEEAKQVARLRDWVGGKSETYRPSPHTSYGLNPKLDRVNTWGFHGPDWTLPREDGALRVLCLGASTTEGGNAAGYAGSYPAMLEQTLERRAAIEAEVFNAGTSGWTTAESLVAWFLDLQDFAPDVVVIHHALSDVMPRNTSGFRPDYSHWRVPLRTLEYGPLERALIRWSDWYARRRVALREGSLEALATAPETGVQPFTEHDGFPAETAGSYRRNVRSIARSAGARGALVCLMTVPLRPPRGDNDFVAFRAGVEEHNAILRELARENGWVLVDAARAFPAALGEAHAEVFRDLVHLKPEGNQVKADLLAGAIAAR